MIARSKRAALGPPPNDPRALKGRPIRSAPRELARSRNLPDLAFSRARHTASCNGLLAGSRDGKIHSQST